MIINVKFFFACFFFFAFVLLFLGGCCCFSANTWLQILLTKTRRDIYGGHRRGFPRLSSLLMSLPSRCYCFHKEICRAPVLVETMQATGRLHKEQKKKKKRWLYEYSSIAVFIHNNFFLVYPDRKCVRHFAIKT